MAEIGRIQHVDRSLRQAVSRPRVHRCRAGLLPAQAQIRRELCGPVCRQGGRRQGAGHGHQPWGELAGDRGGPRAGAEGPPAVSRPRGADCRPAWASRVPRSPLPTPRRWPWPASCLKTALKSGRSAILIGVNGRPSRKRSNVPSRKEIQWSQLRVGALVLAAMAVLIGLIFLMSGSIGRAVRAQARAARVLCQCRGTQGRRAGDAGRRDHRQRDPCERCPGAQSHAGGSDDAGGRRIPARPARRFDRRRLRRRACWATATSISTRPTPRARRRATMRS